MEPNWELARKRTTLEKRARIVQAIRAFFIERDFLEVETPHRIPANAPELYIDAVPSGDWFLHTSPELCMKRLLAAGYERLFQICRCWRQGERGRRHLPEYTMLEWYRPGTDYRTLMEDCEHLLGKLFPAMELSYQGQKIDLSLPWPRLTISEAFRRFAEIPLSEALENNRFDELIALQVEPRLPKDRPTFLIDYPLEHAALARQKPDDPHYAERFELFCGGLELANAFSELCDPEEQRQRFIQEEQKRRQTNKSPYPMPAPFLHELTTMPASSGIALGIDRLTMLCLDTADISDVVAFTPEQL